MNEIDKRAEQLFQLNGEHQVSSALQASKLMETFRKQAEAEVMLKRGAEAQIDSKKILGEQQQELAMMKGIIDSLLKYIIEHSRQQSIELVERNIIEEKRYLENTRMTKIATWTSIFGIIIGVASIALQYIF